MAPLQSSNVTPTIGGDEVGFLLIEDCIGQFKCREFDNNSWVNVDFSKASESHQATTSVCLRGDIALEKEEDNNGKNEFILRSTTRFNGTIQDVQHSPTACPPCCTAGDTNRSDLSLLVGLAMTCQDHGHVKIEKMQVRLHANVVEDESLSDVALQRISFLITFSMPWLDEPSNNNQKLLPISTQLLLSIMRSDWEYLDCNTMSPVPRRFKYDNNLVRDTFFPPKMSLEELYARLRGLQSRNNKKITQHDANLFSNVPKEILCEWIAPFLRAPSLDAWRCTSWDLHQTLKAIAPGLRLSLYSHQIRSLEWMRRRETRQWTENEVLDSKYRFGIDGDYHRCITGGTTVLLRSRSTPQKIRRIDTEYGNSYRHFPSHDGMNNLSRRVARGGLLCDDPGLGKTITVLSLIIQTMGLSSEENTSTKDSKNKAKITQDDIFNVYWSEDLDHVYQRQDLNRLTREAQRLDMKGTFQHPVCLTDYPDYLEAVKKPMCFQEVYSKINCGAYLKSFSAYVNDVDLIFSNALEYNDGDSYVAQLALSMRTNFASLVAEMKRKKMETARRSYANSTARPNSAVAGLMEAKIRQEYIDSLVPSSATLLVVPETLLNHWLEQIMMHVDLRYWTSGQPVIFHFKRNDTETLKRIHWLQFEASETGDVPLIFVDHSGCAKLPEPSFLVLFKVVLTTTKRFTYEWKNGSFEAEMKQKDGTFKTYAADGLSSPEISACPLLKVHWSRLVVDEGHSMGRAKQNNAILFAAWVTANRRWSMTGTPTPQTTARSGMMNLLCLMSFLKHEFFTGKKAGDRVWSQLNRDWNSGSLAAFFQVRSLLAVLMMRHTKLDIAELSPPIFKRVWLEMSPDERRTFNTLVCGVQQNILVTSMKGRTSGLQDSLLHKSQAKHAREAFDNLRLACSGGSRVVPMLSEKSRNEVVTMLKRNHMLSDVKVTVINNFLHRAVNEEPSNCMSCGIEVSTLLIMPCGDLVCSECMTSDTTSCLICEDPFDIDEFQVLQPGFKYDWYDYYKHEDAKKTSEAIMESEPVDQVLLQNALAGQVAMRPIAQSNRKRKRCNEGNCEYWAAAGDGKCRSCHFEHENCVMITESSRCLTCHRTAEECPREESKFFHVISRLDHLLNEWRKKETRRRFSSVAKPFACEPFVMVEERPLKVIVFSQFRKVLNLVGHRLIRRYGTGAVAEFWGSFRTQELGKFKVESDCFCMLLSKDGSEGLDLSFVTHIFFLEEIWDKSLQDQAVARAWRMGAKGRVEVETILAKDSVESLISEIDQKMSGMKARGMDCENSTAILRSKIADILSNLRLIRITPPAKKQRCGDKGRQTVRFQD